MNKIKENVSTATLLNVLSANFTELQARWNCEENSFRAVDAVQFGTEYAEILNANLRSPSFYVGMCGRNFIEELNRNFSKDLSRFQDYREEHIVSGLNRVEPTAIISDNGNRLDLLGTYFYTFSLDGIHFAPSCNITFDSGGTYNTVMCLNFFKHNGKVYCTSVGVQGSESHGVGIILWEEEEGTTWGNTDNVKRFVNPTIVFSYNTGNIKNFGNTFVFYEGGKWYMLIEGAGAISGKGYQIYLAQSDTLNGEFSLVKNDPVLYDGDKDGVGNPELATVDNIPYKCDGKYYMYYHFHNVSKGHAIYRAYSYNLTDWEIEGPMLDTRVPPYREWTKTDAAGDLIGWSNGDQCTCEFKGHAYLFYTNNANQYIDNIPAPDPTQGEDSHIDVCIDFRPWSVLLRIRP